MIEFTKAESERMRRLAQEGKAISKIVEEDFPKRTYADVYFEIYGAGERSSRGIKKMISSRLNRLVEANKAERKEVVEELHDLVWHLYDNHKLNQKKLDAIRKALQE